MQWFDLENIKRIRNDRKKWIEIGLFLMVLSLGAVLRFYQLGADGVGNTYYAAAVKSMLVSWKNFFFVAFEPGGSISIDKPPLGFWFQCVSAYFLGVNGFALALPNALAGVFSIMVVYHLLKRPFGGWAALAGAMALAVMPITIATERNNTIDGLLVFFLLLAAWAFVEAVRREKLRWLILGAVLVGLGFNIKMLQAYMSLPGLYLFYFFGSKQSFRKKILHLSLATVIILVVSFSWAVIVDLTPASQRPYVDSSSNNSAIELIFGHNGVERFSNNRGGAGGGPGGGAPGGRSQPQDASQMAGLPDATGGLSQLETYLMDNGPSGMPGQAGAPAGAFCIAGESAGAEAR